MNIKLLIKCGLYCIIFSTSCRPRSSPIIYKSGIVVEKIQLPTCRCDIVISNNNIIDTIKEAFGCGGLFLYISIGDSVVQKNEILTIINKSGRKKFDISFKYW